MRDLAGAKRELGECRDLRASEVREVPALLRLFSRNPTWLSREDGLARVLRQILSHTGQGWPFLTKLSQNSIPLIAPEEFTETHVKVFITVNS